MKMNVIELVMMLFAVALLGLPVLVVASRCALLSGRGVAFNVTPTGPVIGSLIYFAQDGATVETVTVSSTVLPPATDLATWRSLGCIESFKPNLNRSGGKVIRCFSRGAGYAKARTAGEIVEVEYEITLAQFDDLIAALSHGADGVDGSDEFIPGSASGRVRGFLHCEHYDAESDNIITTLDVWGDLTVTSGPVASEATATVTVKFEVINNALNLGVTANELAG